MIFEENKITLSKARMYVGKGYMIDDLFKMTVVTVIANIKKRNSLLFMCLSLSFCGMVDYDVLIMILCID